MINSITNTAIINRSYVSRGLIVHQSTTHNCVRASDGTLWAAVRERHLLGTINLYKSDDSGFTWNNVFKGGFPLGLGWGGESTITTSGRANGPFMSLCLFENLNKIVMWVSFNYSLTNQNRAWPFIFDATTGVQNLTEVPSNAPDYQIGADGLSIKIAYNENMQYMCCVKGGKFNVRTFFPNKMTLYRSDSLTATTAYVSTFDVVARNDGIVDIAVGTTSNQIQYLRYDDNNQTFASPVVIASFTGTIADIGIVRDGNGTLLCTWSDVSSFTAVPKYATSINNGLSWSAAITIPTTSIYVDAVVGVPARRISALASTNGFIITYVDNVGIPRTYTRTLVSDVLGARAEIATQSNPFDAVVGAHFFEAPAGKLFDISDPGLVQIAFQVGEGNSSTGVDTVPVRFGQELLSDSAYPSNTVNSLPVVDTATSSDRVVNLNVLAGPSDNMDFYVAGAIGDVTSKYLSTFSKAGTPAIILRYNPNVHAETNDRSAYGAPIEIVKKVVLTPMSYEFPFPSSSEDFTSYIERDARRIHMPPDLWLEREFILNAGNFLKRTIWTVLFDGNEYDISQVVPSFINGQITHYSANAYVMGSSNDPFSRVTLVSET